MSNHHVAIAWKSLVSRYSAGSGIACCVGAIWISLLVPLFSAKVPSIGEFVVSAAMLSLLILVVHAILGLPGYFVAKRLGLGVFVFGPIYGFLLGIIASFGFGVSIFKFDDLIFGLATFGLAGLITATTFLCIMRRSRQTQNA